MEIIKVDLRGLEPGTPGWEKAQAAVTSSMVAHGSVVVVAPGALSADLRQALFGHAMPELFALPAMDKQQLATRSGVMKGYLRVSQGTDFESIRVGDPAGVDAIHVRDFGDLHWPEGNPSFFDTIVSFADGMLELEQTVERMTLAGLGVPEEHICPHLGEHAYGVRLIQYYGALPETETTTLSLKEHRDDILMNVIVQHEVGGLEVQSADGRWVAVPPDPDSFTILAGQMFTVVTNGRVPACLHRVRTPRNLERYVAVFGCSNKDGMSVVSAMDDLVDEDHPLLYKPFKFQEYMAFRFSVEGSTAIDPIKTLCGVEATDGRRIAQPLN